jgi:hypothetical protein
MPKGRCAFDVVVEWTEGDMCVKVDEGRIEARYICWTEAGMCEACGRRC